MNKIHQIVGQKKLASFLLILGIVLFTLSACQRKRGCPGQFGKAGVEIESPEANS